MASNPEPAKSLPWRFSYEVKAIIDKSRDAAIDRGSTFIDIDHFLLAMMHDQKDTVARHYLLSVDDSKAIEAYLLDRLKRYRTSRLPNILPLTENAETALKNIQQETQDEKDGLIRSSHLLLCMLRNREYPFKPLHYGVVRQHFFGEKG